MSTPKSWLRWVHENETNPRTIVTRAFDHYTRPADLVERDKEIGGRTDIPPKDTVMVNPLGARVVIAGPPVWDEHWRVIRMPVRWPDGGVSFWPLFELKPFPIRRYRAVYEADSEEEARERYGIPEGVKLEEVER